MDIQEWFSNESLGQFAIALVALRIWVEVTKGLFDKAWQYATGHKPYTVLYAMAIAAFIVFGIKGGDWQANVLNVALLVGMSKIMSLNSESK